MSLIRRRLAVLFVAATITSACGSPAAAPAQEAASITTEAAAAAEAAGNDQAAAADGDEAPPVEPAGQAPEGTAVAGGGTSNAPATTGRLFQVIPEQSSVAYSVEEEFFGQAVPFITAVGRSSAINGEVALTFASDGVTDGVTIDSGRFEVDLRTLTSDRARRDQAIRRQWLESDRFPIATFVAGQARNVPADAEFGKDVRFQVSGDMTIRDSTNPITWDMTARVDGDTLSGTAESFLLMKDYGFDPPEVLGILKVTDGVTVTVTFVAQAVE